jgi:ribonuclease BN (tRNA processing enzyme)
MALAQLPFKQLRHIFLTHHHSDHSADLVTLPLLAWAGGLEHPITIHGPPPLREAVEAGLKQCEFDCDLRAEDEGRPPLKSLILLNEFKEGGLIHQDAAVTVTATRVDHPPIVHAYAYRFDCSSPNWSVVVSGDTCESPGLVNLARNCDILVHEVLLVSRSEMAQILGKAVDHPLVNHIVRAHTTVAGVARVAQQAQAKTLVLSHFVPGDRHLDPADKAKIVAEIQTHGFEGTVMMGEDLMEFTPRTAKL